MEIYESARYYRAEAAREAIERREAMEARDREIDEERARKDEIVRLECEAQDAEDAAYFARIDYRRAARLKHELEGK
jgi:hypothetical protein